MDEKKKVEYYDYNTMDKSKYDTLVPNSFIDKLTIDKDLFVSLLINVSTSAINGTSKDLSEVTIPDILNYIYGKNKSNSVSVMRFYKE